MIPKVVVITGPTATGKTKLAVALAHDFDGEIVSADSMQVYRYMDIGTAKVTPEETEGVPHYMIDIADHPCPGQAPHHRRRHEFIHRFAHLRP